MSGDELFALIISVVIGLVCWKPWIGGLLEVPSSRKTLAFVLAIIFPLLSSAVVLFVLLKWSAHDVRDDWAYILFYMIIWFGWTGVMNRVIALLGVSLRDDVLERGNSAAALALGGATVGISLAYAGGNIGDGPGWWVVIFSAALASGALMLLWSIGSVASGIGDAITVDRDVASGWRVLGFFIAGGSVLGRAVAGDWNSAYQTVTEFIVQGWPVLLIWAGSIFMDVLLRPTPRQPVPDQIWCGVFPCLLHLAAGVGVLLWQGAWK
jgi:hypothetical protein